MDMKKIIETLTSGLFGLKLTDINLASLLSNDEKF